MKIIETEYKLCIGCMEEHDVKIIEIQEQAIFKGIEIEFTAIYEYCVNADIYLETEEMIKANILAVKDAYRKKSDY